MWQHLHVIRYVAVMIILTTTLTESFWLSINIRSFIIATHSVCRWNGSTRV